MDWSMEALLQGALEQRADLRGRQAAVAEAQARLDLEIRSLYAVSLGGLDVEVEAERKDLSNSFKGSWRAVLHPDGDLMVVGTSSGPVGWRMNVVTPCVPCCR